MKILIAAACIVIIAAAGLLFWQHGERSAAAASARAAAIESVRIAEEDAVFRDECRFKLKLRLGYGDWGAMRQQCINAGHITDAEVWAAMN